VTQQRPNPTERVRIHRDRSFPRERRLPGVGVAVRHTDGYRRDRPLEDTYTKVGDRPQPTTPNAHPHTTISIVLRTDRPPSPSTESH